MSAKGKKVFTTEQLFPSVYDELVRTAHRMVSPNNVSQQWNAVELVHEAFLRLANQTECPCWDSRRHLVAAAITTMRRLNIEAARRERPSQTRWRLESDRDEPQRVGGRRDPAPARHPFVVETIELLARRNTVAAKLVRLRCFAGCSVEEAGATLGLSRASAYRQWQYARAWLAQEVAAVSGFARRHHRHPFQLAVHSTK